MLLAYITGLTAREYINNHCRFLELLNPQSRRLGATLYIIPHSTCVFGRAYWAAQRQDQWVLPYQVELLRIASKACDGPTETPSPQRT